VTPIRFAIVGPGRAAHLHAAALARIDGARITAVAGRDLGRAEELAKPHGARPYAGLDALLAAGAADAVIVCTPHPHHRESAAAAARAGMHVVVEKPMALTIADCDEMIAAARSSGVLLSVVSQRRWYEPVRRMKAAIDEGRIGPPILGVAEVLGWRGPEYYALDTWRGTPEGEGGGVLVNQAVHHLDLLLWFMGPVATVHGMVANLNHPELAVEDSAVATVRFSSGALGVVVASNSIRPGLHSRVHVHGRSGASIGVETDRGSSFVAGVTTPSAARNDLWTIPGEEHLAARWEAADRERLAHVDLATHFHELQLRDVVGAIRDGRAPAVDGAQGRSTVALMTGIYGVPATTERT
jgi:UDP-N-acetyl-2-amino-2-deoxyglucuronate dehydrogenase